MIQSPIYRSSYDCIILCVIIKLSTIEMGGVQRRKSGAKNKKLHRGLKTRHYAKDHDQIHEDLKNEEKF